MASTKEWSETVADTQRRAKNRLPKPVDLAQVARSELSVTARDNVDAFSDLGFRPRIADLPQRREQATSVLGRDNCFPVISPTGVQAVHPEAEVAAATAIGLSSFASEPVEQVVAANKQLLFQMHRVETRERTLARMERARAAGATALIVTLNWSFATRPDWDAPPIPEKMNPRTMVKFTPEDIARPRWLLDLARGGTLPDPTTPTWHRRRAATHLLRRLRRMDEYPATNLGGHPVTARGVQKTLDGRWIPAPPRSQSPTTAATNLDGTPASVRALAGVVDAVGDQGRVAAGRGSPPRQRRGQGAGSAARAVMIGRAYHWGMAANGEAGVTNVLSIARGGIDETLLGLGKPQYTI